MNRRNQSMELLPPAVRLAGAYVAIIMFISVAFSVALYQVSSDQLQTSLRRQIQRFHPPDGFNITDSPDQVQVELDDGQRRLRLQLLYWNLIILGLGSAISYQLAKRTLQPIEDALEAQSRFTGDASHELRTPLTAMQTEIEVALRNPNLTKDEARQLLTSNLEEVAKLRALSDGLLRLARADGNGIEFGKVSLVEVVNEAVKRLEPAAKLRKITIINELADITVRGDLDSLVELVVILLDNAIKYSDAKSTITVTAAAAGGMAALQIKDQGQGIKASDLMHIFERFYRADRSRSKEEIDGYGLGLSIAQQIVKLHHGSITATSTPGQGSTFVVKLPLARV